MMRRHGWTVVLAAICLPIGTKTLAAQFPGSGTPNDTLHSVWIHPDNTVTLRIYAPKASEVLATGDFGGGWQGTQLSRNDAGVWSVTVGPLDPELYTYEFRVDGVKVLDPKSAEFKEAENGLSNTFTMPDADYLAVRDVPHGRVETVWFHAGTLDRVVRVHVYTPPGYDDTDNDLPVLYLQHGGGDNDASWTTAGRANFILDNLIARGEAEPMIVVMPMGNPGGRFFPGIGVEEDPYYEHLVHDIIPYIESRYRVRNDPSGRAYAGLSMGGLQALNVALFYPELFDYVLPLSTGFFPDQLPVLERELASTVDIAAINDMSLLWIAMGGENDIAYENGENTKRVLAEHGVHFEEASYPAGHTFITWRHNLLEFAPLLFR